MASVNCAAGGWHAAARMKTLAPLTRSWTLGVRPAYPAQSRSYQAVINAEQNWQLPPEALAGYQRGGLQALLSVSSRPPLQYC